LFGGANDLRLQAMLEDELPNIRAVEEWCRVDPIRGEATLRIGAALHWFWFAQGRFLEGRSWLDAALAHRAAAPPLVQARALIARGHLAIWQGEASRVRPPLEEAVAILRALDEPRTLAVALAGLASGALGERALTEAAALIDEALALVNDDRTTVLRPFILYW